MGSLKSLGITSIFEPYEAEFTEISDEELYVSSILHRAELKVDEEGSEAAAATGVVLGTKSFRPPTVHEFRVVGFQDTLLYDMEKGDPAIDEMMCFSKGSPQT